MWLPPRSASGSATASVARMGEVNLASAWERVADRHGDRPALFHGDVVRSWSEFEDRAARLAGAFAAAGVGPAVGSRLDPLPSIPSASTARQAVQIPIRVKLAKAAS